MVAVSRIVSCMLSFAVASAAAACGSIIGIEDGTLDPELSGGNEGGTGGDSGPRADARSPIDASSAAPDAASARGPLAPPGGNTTSLPCSAASCPLPAQQCCAYHTRDTSNWTAECSSVGCPGPAPSEDFGFAIRCSGPQNCAAGMKCCANQQTASCKATCSFTEFQACTPGATDACPSGATCAKASFLPTGYAVCFRDPD